MPLKDLEVLSRCIHHIHHTSKKSCNSNLFPSMKYLKQDENHGDGGDTLTVTYRSNNNRQQSVCH